MKRIIPWALPSVNGGSEGGYTPQPTPEPEPEESRYNIENINLEKKEGHVANQVRMNIKNDGTLSINTSDFGTRHALSGIEIVNLVGIASIQLKLTASATIDGVLRETNNATFTLDVFEPNSISGEDFISGTYTGTPFANLSNYWFTISKYTLVCYDGSGTIVDLIEQEVTP